MKSVIIDKITIFGSMKAIILLLAISFSLKSQILNDKDKHFLVNSMGAPTLSIALYKITDRPLLSIITSSLLFTGVNFLKEDYDRKRGRKFDGKDIAAGTQGLVTGNFIAGLFIVLKIEKECKIETWKYENIN